jgi:hypothetical protein
MRRVTVRNVLLSGLLMLTWACTDAAPSPATFPEARVNRNAGRHAGEVKFACRLYRIEPPHGGEASQTYTRRSISSSRALS